MKQPVDAIKHVLVLDKLAPVGLRDAPSHICEEAGLIVQHAGNGVFHQLLCVLAAGRGHLLEPGFDVGGEMYFRALTRRSRNQKGKSVTMPEWASYY
ncbi:MAG TPA: hypothetical protein VGL72_18885 [Bryobacteraceae bacterium]